MGKSTTCENLGIGLAMEGKKVLLVDTDPQGSLTISMGWQQPDELPTTLSTLMQADRAKTKSSLRTLPLVPPIRDRLLMLKGQQDTYRRLCGKSYNRDYLGYLCVDEIGNIIRPNYVSEQFPKLLEKNGLRPIRFHDLRHSCASLLLANGVPMKQIQEWLGHSDFSTTANIYAHLDYASKLSSAQAMLEGLGYGNASA